MANGGHHGPKPQKPKPTPPPKPTGEKPSTK